MHFHGRDNQSELYTGDAENDSVEWLNQIQDGIPEIKSVWPITDITNTVSTKPMHPDRLYTWINDSAQRTTLADTIRPTKRSRLDTKYNPHIPMTSHSHTFTREPLSRLKPRAVSFGVRQVKNSKKCNDLPSDMQIATFASWLSSAQTNNRNKPG